jgi:dTDP-4-amino-4,6-dideoxygalactose transaminase
MYIPSWPGLALRDFVSPPSRPCFPFSAPHQLHCYLARNGIYHLFRALRPGAGETVLVPDYHSGNEVSAMLATGASLAYYPIRRDFQPDLEALFGLVQRLSVRAIYVIHYLGWPQPVEEIRALCRERGAILVEDCALALLSETGGVPLGGFGDYSIFCLYKTLPVPNGGLLLQNCQALPEIGQLALKPSPAASVLGRSAELLLEALRTRSDRIGGALFSVKRRIGSAMRAARVPQVMVGDIGWNPDHVNLGMSRICAALLRRLNYEVIREKRRNNFLLLAQMLEGRVEFVRTDLPAGVCPLFFPILVRDKHATAQALWDRGIGAVEFWNYGHPHAKSHTGAEARFLRDHVLELPIHQGLSSRHVAYIAEQLLRLQPRPPEPLICRT